MSKQKRLFSLLVCAGMLLMLLVSSAYIAHEAGHDCTGQNCPICQFIARVEQVQRDLGTAVLALLLLCFFLPPVRPFHPGSGEDSLPAFATPVSQKIRLND